jgi:DUF971 family protein
LANVFVSSSGRAVQTDSFGNYTLQSLAAGTAQHLRFRSPSRNVSGQRQAQVNIGQTTSGINIVILRPSTIAGNGLI